METDVDQKAAYTNKLNEQLTLVDPVLNQLYDAVNSLKPTENPSLEAANKAARSLLSIKLKICSSQRIINSKIALVRDAEKDEEVQSSLPKVKANLQLLEDVKAITTKDLDEICKQIIKEDLNEGDVETLMAEVAELVDSSLQIANGLKVRLLEVDA